MKKSLTFLLIIIAMVGTQAYTGNNKHKVYASQSAQCLQFGPVTLSLKLEGFTKPSTQWEKLGADSVWHIIAGANKLTFTTDSAGIYRAVVEEIGNCDGQGTYYSPDIILLETCGILPVKLSSFFGSIKNNVVALQWQTSSEVNTARFEVQESIDGSYFAIIDTVNALGNSSITQQYSVTEEIPADNNGQLFYRLEMIDIDGKVSFSSVEHIAIENNNSTTILTVYPNPTSTNITLNRNDLTKAKIRIIDVTGREMYKANSVVGNTIDVSKWPAGVYTCTLVEGTRVISTQFVKK